jgi:hypothetical protein
MDEQTLSADPIQDTTYVGFVIADETATKFLDISRWQVNSNIINASVYPNEQAAIQEREDYIASIQEDRSWMKNLPLTSIGELMTSSCRFLRVQINIKLYN